MSSVPADQSASYAAEVARLLWPEPWDAPYVTRTRHRPGLPHRDAYIFPSERRPRLLVPADVPGSSSMLRRIGNDRSALAGPVRSVLERSVRSRAFALARWPMLRVPGTDPRADSIENHLAGCLGREVRVGVVLGTRRVNQKPVLQVFGLDGTLLGFAKVGHNPLTAALVRREAESLSSIGGHRPHSFRAPRVLHHGQWNGLEVLVLSPLSTDQGQVVPSRTRLAAMREVASLAGSSRAPLADSAFWSRLRETIGLLPGAPGSLPVALDSIEQSSGSVRLSLGGWHGDWGPWNMGMDGQVLQLWDWERYDAEVPLGFDALHFIAQGVRPGQREERRQEETFLRSVPDALAGLGVDSDHHDLTLRLYLVEVAARYTDALTHGATPALRRRTSWVLSLLDRLSLHPRPELSKGRP
jgi:hypothetical protein